MHGVLISSKLSPGRQAARSGLYGPGKEQEAPSDPVNADAGSPLMVFPPFGAMQLGSLFALWHLGHADGFPS